MSNTSHAGVDHAAIDVAADRVKQLAQTYHWNCLPGKWLMYCMLLALPFSEKVVRPPPGSQSPVLPESQYSLPLAVGRLFDATVLSSDALRPLADEWCRRVVDCLRAAGGVVTPLRTAAENRRDQSRAAARDAAHVPPGPSRRHRKPASQAEAARGAAHVAEAASQAPATGRRGARASTSVHGTARAAHPAPSATGRRRTAPTP